MSRLSALTWQEVVRALERAGFVFDRQKGSHIILTKETVSGKRGVVVPNHKEIDKGTLLEIIRQAGMTKEEFISLVK